MKRDIPIPDQMKGLPLDKRGFPIPFIVARDNAGLPLFTVNDDRLTTRCIAESLCGICGLELTYGDLWWVGGPLSAFHPGGCYVDGPMHAECSTYALMACPHLAAPKYTKRLDALPAMKNGTDFDVHIDHTVMPDRPLVFVQGQSVSYDVSWPFAPDRKLFPVSGIDEKNATGRKRWLHYEVWQHGELLDEDEGLTLVRQAFDEMKDQTVRAPRVYIPEQPGLIV
jgi:hypothetical protein